MRVAIDIRSLTGEYPTGVAAYTTQLTRALARKAPDIDFYLFASGSQNALARLPHFHEPNLKLHTVHLPNRLLSSQLLMPFGTNLEDFLPEQPDFWIFPKFDVIATRLPYLLTVHDLAFDIFPELITRKERLYQRLIHVRRLTAQADKILAVSERTAQDLTYRWDIPDERIQVTPLGVDHETYRPREQASDRSFRATYDLNRPYFLTLATQEPRKNLESVLEAYEMYRQAGGAPYPLALAGGEGWKTRGFRQLLARHKYRGDIWLIGYVPEKHKPALLRGAVALLFPSFYEGFGLPAVEALACGIPVITTVTGSLPEILGDTAIFVDPFQVNDLAQALRIVTEERNSPIFVTRRARGLTRAADFTWDKTAEQTLKAIEQVAHR